MFPKMKVGYISTAFWPAYGGIDGGSVHIEEIIRAFKKKGVDVFLVCPNPGKVSDEVRIYPIYPLSLLDTSRKFASRLKGKAKGSSFSSENATSPISELNRRAGNFLTEIDGLLYNYHFYKEAEKIVKEEKPDFLYERFELWNLAGISIAKRFGIPIILEVNGLKFEEIKIAGNELYLEHIAKIIEKKVFLGVDAIVVASNIIKDYMVDMGIPEKKIHLMYNGVDPELFNTLINENKIRKKYSLEDKIVVGYVGTLKLYYDIPLLIDVAKELVNIEPDIHFFIVGDGPERGLFEEKVRNLQLEPYFTFTGNVPHKNIADYINVIDIATALIVKSCTYPLLTKVFEYMAMAKPVLTTNLGDIKNIISDGVNGILVRPGDKDELKYAILKLIQNKHLREKLGRNAGDTVKDKFTWQGNVERVLEIYSAVRCQEVTPDTT